MTLEGVWHCVLKVLIDLLASQEANKSISLFGKYKKHFFKLLFKKPQNVILEKHHLCDFWRVLFGFLRQITDIPMKSSAPVSSGVLR